MNAVFGINQGSVPYLYKTVEVIFPENTSYIHLSNMLTKVGINEFYLSNLAKHCNGHYMQALKITITNVAKPQAEAIASFITDYKKKYPQVNLTVNERLEVSDNV